MTKLVTLYKSLSPAQLADVIALDWKAFAIDFSGQKFFSPKLHRCYAEMLARQLEAAHYAAGYVVSFQVRKSFIEGFELQTIGYCEHQEYRIPVSALRQLNTAIVGRIKLISGFAEQESEFGCSEKIKNTGGLISNDSLLWTN